MDLLSTLFHVKNYHQMIGHLHCDFDNCFFFLLQFFTHKYVVAIITIRDNCFMCCYSYYRNLLCNYLH